MKSFIKSLRLIYAGFLLGAVFMAWALGEDEKKKTNKKFNDIVDKYNDPDWISEKMYGEENA